MCEGRVGGSEREDLAGDRVPDAMEEETPRVKFLCSFGGSILPRPSDGRLRYVGGETRIVSLPRDVSYADLLARVRELFEAAWSIKYQQPDEDLDALVSVVNDDDVINMMEEYDKLGSVRDGFTRLRIFLFAQPDQEGSGSLSSPRFDADERESERRYVDALNSLPDGRIQLPESPAAEFNRAHAGTEQFMVGMDGYGHQFSNLHQLKIPRVPSYGQRYSDVDSPWSPAAACYSPGHHTPGDFSPSPSPSTGRFHVGVEESGDRVNVNDDYVRHLPMHMYDHHPSSPFVDNGNLVWFPPGGVVAEKAGFPGNLGHSHSGYEGNSVCEHCHMAMQRNQALVPGFRYHEPRHDHHQAFTEQLGSGVEYPGRFSSSCPECLREREVYLLNQGMKMDPGAYGSEAVEQRTFYSDPHGHDRTRILPHNPINRPDEMRGPRNIQYGLDGNGMSFPYVVGNSYGGHSFHPNCIPLEVPQYVRPPVEPGNEVYQDQSAIAAGVRNHVPPLENNGIQYGINAQPYRADGLYQTPHGASSVHSLRRIQVPACAGPSYEASAQMLQTNGALNVAYNRVAGDGSPRSACAGVANQFPNPLTGQSATMSQQMSSANNIAVPEEDITSLPKPNLDVSEKGHAAEQDPAVYQASRVDRATSRDTTLRNAEGNNVASASSLTHASPRCNSDLTVAVRAEENKMKEPDLALVSNGFQHLGEKQSLVLLGETNFPELDEKVDYSAEKSEMIASVKSTVLEVVNAGDQVSNVSASYDQGKKEISLNGLLIPKNDSTKALEVNSDDEQPVISQIEPTTAEEEAFAKGLQTIKNDDLEEIRELGTGTYGAVYHGKWKGSDVAIKRIKASCFSGRPSERERLIADFWKEASILGSLHHPNVVSFYGVVRDGPDGSLATVTEFMVNGSLKQFLQKKDRTIDRRKRLILAMDASFGMEYLHEKNIVHFDLKCENLLVNMRDPHRPVCKIGDLGLSKVKQHTMVSGGVRGTLPWMAPELLSGKSNMVTNKVDVYSFGIVMWELLSGEEPYAGMNCAAIIGGIVNNTLRPQIPAWCDPEWKSLMESCWSSDPGERPSFSEISQKLRKMSAEMNIK